MMPTYDQRENHQTSTGFNRRYPSAAAVAPRGMQKVGQKIHANHEGEFQHILLFLILNRPTC